MIVSTNIYYTISGKNFNPIEVEKDFDFTFSKVELKDELIQTSKATIYSKSENYIQDDEEIFRLASLAIKISENAKKYGIEDSDFHIYFNYAAQCNLSFDKKVLTVLSKLDFVSISCIKIYDRYETKQISDNQEFVKFYSDDNLEKEVTLNNVYIKSGA